MFMHFEIALSSWFYNCFIALLSTEIEQCKLFAKKVHVFDVVQKINGKQAGLDLTNRRTYGICNNSVACGDL